MKCLGYYHWVHYLISIHFIWHVCSFILETTGSTTFPFDNNRPLALACTVSLQMYETEHSIY